MSTPLGTDFGSNYGEKYAAVLEKWAPRLKGVKKISEPMKKEWAADLRKALEEDAVIQLLEHANVWKPVGDFPSEETLRMFAQTAAKDSLSNDMFDLLERLRLMAQEPEPKPEFQGCIQWNELSDEPKDAETLLAAIQVSEALKRVGQTVSQIFDMVKDKFNQTMDRYHRRRGNITGRRRWRTNAIQSRHSALEGQVRNEGEYFNYNGREIYGPRPPGGAPADWSNCSCSLAYEKPDGSWTSVR